MVLPILLPLAGSIVSGLVGKAAGQKEGEEKLELIKKLANLTPEQAQAVDAVSKMDVDEARERVKHGVGPFGELPSQASDKARAARRKTAVKPTAAVDAIAASRQQGGMVTSADRAAIAAAPDKKAAVNELVNSKVAQAKELLRIGPLRITD